MSTQKECEKGSLYLNEALHSDTIFKHVLFLSSCQLGLILTGKWTTTTWAFVESFNNCFAIEEKLYYFLSEHVAFCLLYRFTLNQFFGCLISDTEARDQQLKEVKKQWQGEKNQTLIWKKDLGQEPKDVYIPGLTLSLAILLLNTKYSYCSFMAHHNRFL